MFRNDFSRREARSLSRRQFLGTGAGAAGAALGASLWLPRRVRARHRVPPQPIPGGIIVHVGGEDFFIHHYPPMSGNEPSLITDLNGQVGLMRVLGTGVGRNTDTGEHTALLFQADMGFMRGEYVGEDGHRHEGAFGFI
jgi:hypothetical protein